MKYYGFCTTPMTGPTEWGDGDVMGILFIINEGGNPKEVSHHYCSSPRFAEHDIGVWHYQHRPNPADDDTYEWLGQLSPEQLEARFP